MISIPLVILSARFLITREYVNLVVLTKKLKVQSFLIVTATFWFYFVFYVGVTTFLHVIPFSFRKTWYNIIYYSIVRGNIRDVVLIAMVFVFLQSLFFVFIVPKIRTMKDNLEAGRYFKRIIFIIIFFQLFLHGKWLITSQNHLHDLSVKLGQVLPENSILTGGWSAGLTLENRLRALVVQGDMKYNGDVIDRIRTGEGIPVVTKKDGLTVKTTEKDTPIYILVSPNAPFEKKIISAFKPQLDADHKVLETEFGYFDVEMYRLDMVPGKERDAIK